MKNRKTYIRTLSLSALLITAIFLFAGCNSEKEPENATTTYIATAETTSQTEKIPVKSDENETEVVSEIVTDEEGKTEIVTEIVTKKEEITTKKSSNKDTSTSQSKTFTTDEIVEMFNKSANKIKTDASKVVKNYENRTVNRDKTSIPAAVEAAAEDMLASLMKDDTEPIVYATRNEIVENYLVPKQNYVSKMRSSDVVKATCVDKGDEYEVYFKLKNQTNPTAGVGIGAVCDVIEANEVAEGAPFVDKFTTEYYNCEIKATINKSTGKITHANYTTPLVLNITVSMFGKHDISIGFTFEKDYTITY